MSIEINKTLKADTRIVQKEITKADLLHDTKAHIDHVIKGGDFFCELLKDQLKRHDHTKIQFIDEFYQDFVKAQQGETFKDLPWWQIHLEERHHLKDRTPRDVNLIDVIDSIIDHCVAGKARSGDVYPYELSEEILQRAIQNTVKLILCNIEVKEN